MSELEFIYKRKSIRSYKKESINKEEIIKMLNAAVHAPSPMNEQGWHFVIVQDRKIINEMADVVTRGHKKITSLIKNSEDKEKYARTLPYHLNFKNAPCTVLVYVKHSKRIVETTLKENNYSEEIINTISSHKSEIQAVGAAIENFILAAAAMGYGTCWMTGISVAKREIEKIIPFHRDKYSLIAAISLGVPDDKTIYGQKSIRKPLEEVVTFI